MKYSKSNILLQKSIGAAKAAIEVYNKPVFSYRNETFAILMINAWELLLKAKRLKDNKNKMSSIYVKERVKTKKGQLGQKEYYKKNRSGNFLTCSIHDLIKTEIQDPNLSQNLYLLIEIRDNAVHFSAYPQILEKHYLEIIGASISSYQTALSKWFGYSIEDDDLFIIPIGFNMPKEYNVADVKTKEEKNILKYISETRNKSVVQSDFDIALNIELKFTKSKDIDAISVRYEENGIPIRVDSEDQFKNKYPLSYDDLVKKLTRRYKNFKRDKQFFALKKNFEKNKKYAGTRYLDYYTQKGVKKTYYSTEIFKEFDKVYKTKEPYVVLPLDK